MKITCSQYDLIEAVNVVQKAVSTKSTIPLLECMLLTATDQFYLTGNDAELAIEKIVPAEIHEKGSIAVNARMFSDIVRKLDNEIVYIELKENQSLSIDCGSTHIDLKGLDPSGFPNIPVIEEINKVEINQLILKDMIRQTIFAVGTDEFKPILTGCLVEFYDNKINIVAIDGMRIALRTCELEDAPDAFNVVIPGKTLNEISKIIGASEEEKIKVSVAENLIMFEFGNTKVVSKLLEGEFFNYRVSIPETFNTTIICNTKKLFSSIELASILNSTEKRYHIRFKINNDKLIILANTDTGNIVQEVDVDFDGDPLEIAFNPKYFLDVLKVLEDEKVEICFSSAVGPCVIRPIEGNNFMYLVLPLRIKGE